MSFCEFLAGSVADWSSTGGGVLGALRGPSLWRATGPSCGHRTDAKTPLSRRQMASRPQTKREKAGLRFSKKAVNASLASAPAASHRTGDVPVPVTRGAPKSIKRSPLRLFRAMPAKKCSSSTRRLDGSRTRAMYEKYNKFRVTTFFFFNNEEKYKIACNWWTSGRFGLPLSS